MKTKIVSSILVIGLSITFTVYWSEKKDFEKQYRNHTIDVEVNLTDKEKLLNNILMNYKINEINLGYTDPDLFLAGQHFFKTKEYIEKSEVFNIIKQFPKGSVLHTHDVGFVSQEYIFNLTFRDNLYGCVDNDNFALKFFSKENIQINCNWTLLSNLRKSNVGFDAFLKTKLTLIHGDPDKLYPNTKVTYAIFIRTMRTLLNVITYKPVFEDYFYQALKEHYEDNVKYLEFRSFLPNVYDLEGNIYSNNEVVSIYYNTLKRFKQDYPDFIGAKLIYASPRDVDNTKMREYINIYKQIKEKFPDFVAGFDLIGLEYSDNPLSYFKHQLLEISDIGAKFFFHAGESNWFGELLDHNLFDAILLNTTRIGIGYDLLKHPAAVKLVKERNIPIEICPISNQVFKLVSDLRNHPAAILIANRFSVVICTDTPSFWGAKGASYDWYVTFMAMTSKYTDLRFLKQLAFNSIKYSSLNKKEKILAFSQWTSDWNTFVDKVLKESH